MIFDEVKFNLFECLLIYGFNDYFYLYFIMCLLFFVKVYCIMNFMDFIYLNFLVDKMFIFI